MPFPEIWKSEWQRNSVLCRGWGGGIGAASARGGGAGWLGAHVVADAGHDVADVTLVVVVDRVEQQAQDDLDVAGQDEAEEGLAGAGDGGPVGHLLTLHAANSNQCVDHNRPSGLLRS